MYMANARNLRLGPNATYIPLTRVGGFESGDAKNCASPNAKDTNMLVYFIGDAKVPNANGFASQWNIGFRTWAKIFINSNFHTVLTKNPQFRKDGIFVECLE